MGPEGGGPIQVAKSRIKYKRHENTVPPRKTTKIINVSHNPTETSQKCEHSIPGGKKREPEICREGKKKRTVHKNR